MDAGFLRRKVRSAVVLKDFLATVCQEQPAGPAAQGGLQPVPGVARPLTRCCSSIPA